MVDLNAEYAKLKAQGELLAGDLNAIPRRVSILTSIYLDSNRNHAFSQMAAHGALWAINYFEAGGSLGRLVSYRYFYNSNERAYRMGILREFAEAFRSVNRQVCIDTYANYHFTKNFGGEAGADSVIEPRLLEALNCVHHASRNALSLTAEEKRRVFEASFHCEQEITVAPGVAKAVSEFDCRIMRALCMHPIVRFTYFPRFRYMYFRDFSNTDERISKGLLAYDIAARVGWDRVFEAMKYYGQMPRDFLQAPLEHFQAIRDDAIRSAGVALTLKDG